MRISTTGIWWHFWHQAKNIALFCTSSCWSVFSHGNCTKQRLWTWPSFWCRCSWIPCVPAAPAFPLLILSFHCWDHSFPIVNHVELCRLLKSGAGSRMLNMGVRALLKYQGRVPTSLYLWSSISVSWPPAWGKRDSSVLNPALGWRAFFLFFCFPLKPKRGYFKKISLRECSICMIKSWKSIMPSRTLILPPVCIVIKRYLITQLQTIYLIIKCTLGVFHTQSFICETSCCIIVFCCTSTSLIILILSQSWTDQCLILS